MSFWFPSKIALVPLGSSLGIFESSSFCCWGFCGSWARTCVLGKKARMPAGTPAAMVVRNLRLDSMASPPLAPAQSTAARDDTSSNLFQCYTPPLIKIMPSSFNHWLNLTLPNALHLLGIFVIALVVNRILRAITNLLIKHTASQTRAAQIREQQTRTLAGVLYGAASKVIWGVALLTALPEFGINVTPVATLAGLASLAIGFGAQNLVRDIITGFYIVLEDQYVVGDTIQFADYAGRVEHLTLRRTVIRDARGALAWSQTLVDGPRILGVQSFDRSSATVRLQVRTAPTRQDEVARELRRRIQVEFQKQGIPVSSVHRIELAGVSHSSQEAGQADAAS